MLKAFKKNLFQQIRISCVMAYSVMMANLTSGSRKSSECVGINYKNMI
jgi:hypothetical protein